MSKEERLVAIKLTTGQRKGSGGAESTNEAISVGGATKMEVSKPAAPEAAPEAAPASDKKTMDV